MVATGGRTVPIGFSRHAGLVPASKVQQPKDSVVEGWTPEQVRGDAG